VTNPGGEVGGGESPADVADLLQDVARRARRAAAHLLSPLGITGGQLRALRVLAQAGVPLRMSELAERLEVVPRSVTSVIDALEGQGLVERSADPADRRATWVRPTSAGEALLEAVTVQRRAATTSLLDRLSPDERAQLAHLLRVLAEAEPGSTGTV
jgi:DNA-binding MarR family transcriptional regulator